MLNAINHIPVIPAQAGIQLICKARVADKTPYRHALRGFFNQLDSRLRGNDEVKGGGPC
jgi:hypothetical protein